MRRAARQEHVLAQYQLGCFYEQGIGVKKNLPEAAKWYLKAMKHGNAEAKQALENLSRKLNVIPADKPQTAQ